MSVQSELAKTSYTLGATITTPLDVPFYFLEASHLKVILIKASSGIAYTLALTTSYTVVGAGLESGLRTVTLTGATVSGITPAYGDIVTITRNVPLSQTVDYVPNAAFPAATHERALDKLTMAAQQIKSQADTALRLGEGEDPLGAAALSTVLNLSARKGKTIQFNATTGAVELTDSADSAAAAAQASATAAAGSASEAAASAASITPALFAMRNMSAETAGTGIIFAGGGSLTGDTGSLTLTAGGTGNRSILLLPLGDTGRVTVGAGTDGDTFLFGALISKTVAGGSGHTVEVSGQLTGSSGYSHALVAAEGTYSGVNWGHLNSFQSKAFINITGTMDWHAAFDCQHTIQGTATVTELYGLKLNTPNKDGGATITRYRGIYIAGATNAATNWALYSEGASTPSYHAGVWRQGGNMAVGITDTESLSGFGGVKLWVKGGVVTNPAAPDATNDVVVIDHIVATAFNFRNNSTDSAWLYWSDATRAVGRFGYQHSNDSFLWYSNSTLRATLSGTNFDLDVKLKIDDTTEATTGPTGALVCMGGAYFDKKLISASSIQTGSPSGGTTQPWKLGSLLTSGGPYSLNTARAVEIDINGTAVKLAVLN